jgi:hypothetical protein
MHLADLEGQSMKLSKGNWGASVTITVHDTNHGLVEGATVAGTFYQDGTMVATVSGTTGPDGTCTVDSGALPNKKGKAKATFEVDTITHATTLTYEPAMNDVPDSIVISK